ncbi:MAG: 50S ribosomal protein L11 methyltransferase [Sphingobacteriales bacterium JAD_PAG50586_3]|nr:MAG: 50S ribosomal protein L11 methyltransferase [Sphingobacteriales bacterium JAD_PAG50586_3]
MNYVEVELITTDSVVRDIVTAEFAELGFESFTESDESLKAYIQEGEFDAQRLDTLLRAVFPHNMPDYKVAVIQQQNWNEEWEKNYDPVIIDDFCCLRASFHPKPESVELDILIDPKMSFGTGHHPTTVSVIRLMREIDFTAKTVFDYGCGTGVLSIVADKLGAKSITAIDIDEWSLENSEENFRKNGMEQFDLSTRPLDSFADTEYDIILANINKNIIIQSLSNLAKISKSGTPILFSGFFTHDLADISEAAAPHGFIYIKHISNNDWAAALFTR